MTEGDGSDVPAMEADAVDVVPDVEPPDIPRDRGSPAPDGDPIGSLFARLRDTPAEASSSKPATPPAVLPSPAESVADDSESEPAPEPAPDATPVVDTGEPTAESVATSIRAQNDALRVIKRSLVELQNETLEHLRTDSSWVPNEGFTNRFEQPFSTLAGDVGGGTDAATGTAFAVDLLQAVTSAIERARSAGGGDREVAAATSKVFRTWRSDEAERRVAEAARSMAGV